MRSRKKAQGMGMVAVALDATTPKVVGGHAVVSNITFQGNKNFPSHLGQSPMDTFRKNSVSCLSFSQVVLFQLAPG